MTVSDKKIPHTTDGTTIDYYNADVITANDYYPFGSQMPGRKYSQPNSSYRYGFNGKEQDKETTGTTTYDYGFRIYNPALGRFLSVDPLTKSYPWYSPYQFAGNKPIIAIDLDGLEEYIVVTQHFKDGSVKSITIQYTQTKADAKARVDAKLREVHNGAAAGNYIAEGEKVLRIEQDYNGKDISRSHSNSLTPNEIKIIKENSENETPVNKEQDIWYLKYKGKNYESDENTTRNTTTMTDKIAYKEFNLKSYKTINDLPAITVADGNENGNLDLNSKSNFKTELDTYLKDITNQGNVNKIKVNLNINIRGTDGGTGNMLPYIEKAKAKISSQIQQYIKTKTGVDLKQIDVKINAQNGDPSKGNTTINTQ